MQDNSENRLLDVFFYGLYMDPDLLRQRQVSIHNPRFAILPDYQLRLGNKASLLRVPGRFSIGMLYSMTHAHLHALYWGAGLDAYGAEAVMLRVVDESIQGFESLSEAISHYGNLDRISMDSVAALCCNLIVPPASDESNPVYRENLISVMRRLQIPIPDELT